MPPQFPRPPVGPLSAEFNAQRLSLESQGSSHALDNALDIEPMPQATDASSQNRADGTADLNFVNIPLPTPDYKDVHDQLPFKTSDKHADNDRSFRRLMLTLIRGRAMPVRGVFITTVWGAVAVVLTYVTSFDYGPNKAGDCRWWCSPLSIDSDALSYVGFALFLLTSFRVSEAYNRYMEAARVWTNMAGTVTSFAKYIVQAFPRGMFHPGDRERILGFLVAFPVALKRELRGERDLSELKTVLTGPDLGRLQNAESMSAYCLYVLSGYVLRASKQESRFPQSFIVHLIGWIADLAGSADVCMQIKIMPAPYSYVTHLNTFLASWLFFLPFALVETTGWGTIVITSFIGYGILGVVSNAAELEDPFGSDYNDLPLGKMSQNIVQSVAVIYNTSLRDGSEFVCQVDDKDLRKTDTYWLRSKEE